MYCTNCGGQMQDNQAVCLHCGVAKNVGNKFCPNCGSPVAENAAVCVNCGVSLKKNGANGANPNYLNGQDKVVMALLCFFLGGLGIHNFVMGETKKGIFRIIMSCICGIGYIFALIDFVKILTGSYVVDPEKLV